MHSFMTIQYFLLLPLGAATVTNSDSTATRPGSRDARRGPLCLDLLVSPHVRLTQITPPMRCFLSHICLQLTANQPRPWPLIIHRPVTFVLYTSPVTSYLFILFDNEPLPTEKDTLWNIYWGLFPKMGSLGCPDLQKSNGGCDLSDRCHLFWSLLCWGATEFLLHLLSEGLCNLDRDACILSNHKWELCDCVLHFMFSQLTNLNHAHSYLQRKKTLYFLLKSSSLMTYFHRCQR